MNIISTPDLTGFDVVRWGITIQEAKDALGDGVTMITPRESTGALVERLSKSVALDGSVVMHAGFCSRPQSDRIDAVRLVPPLFDHDSEADRLAAYLELKTICIAHYGRPVVEDAQLKNTERVHQRMSWRYPSTSIELTHIEDKHGIGIVILLYQSTGGSVK